tara:strand:- start:1122 stop:1382 length:261 start_codon:yes stop_codon:yes gene_type:complete
MKQKILQNKYAEILKVAELATGRKETVSLLHKAEKIRSKISKKVRYNCKKCNGYGYRRTSIDGAKTCLNCFGKGFVVVNPNKTSDL